MRRSAVPWDKAGWTCLAALLVCLATGWSLQGDAPAATAAEGAQQEKAAPKYMGTDSCKLCHAAHYERERTTAHGRRLLAWEAQGQGHSCEGCHGPGEAHMGNPTEKGHIKRPAEGMPAELNAVCLNCHQRAVRRHEWAAGAHARGNVSCVTCHKLTEDGDPNHLRKPEAELCLGCHRATAGEFSLNSHHPVLREGHLKCSSCHDVHRALAKDADEQNQACASCHRDRRGPYLYEHGAITSGLTDGCLSCHQAHGSPNRFLLKLTGRGLCLQCHADRVLHFPGPQCTSCHRAIHGSNSHPLFFTP